MIKIDGSLIRNIDTDKNAEEVVRSIIEFARSKQLETIAEFVHSAPVQEKVAELGIDYSQGYFLGKPGLLVDDPVEALSK